MPLTNNGFRPFGRFAITDKSQLKTMESENTKTVYCNGWTYSNDCEGEDWEGSGGGGFNWYHTNADRDQAHQAELETAELNKTAKWTAYRFDVQVPKDADKDTITELCNAVFDSIS